MKHTKKKSFFSRMITMMMAVFTLAVVMAFPVSASAAEAPAAQIVTMEAQNVPVMPHIMPMANNGGNNNNTAATASGADASFDNMIDFVTKWFTRIGLAVALVGGIMFGLSIKDDNADGKQRGLMTLVAGLVVAAICAAAKTMFPGL